MIQEFFKPETVLEAVELKEKYKNDIYFCAGGTEINSIIKPERVISVEQLGFNKVIENENEFIIGSNVCLQEIVESNLPEIIIQSCRNIVNRNIRNIATIGGNIGANKTCSNILPVLVALEADILIAQNNGEKKVSILDYIKSDCQDLILSIIVSKKHLNKKLALRKFSRTANDISILNVAVSYNESEGTLQDIIVALGGVDSKVIKFKLLEEKMNGKDKLPYDEIVKLVQNNVTPLSDIRGSSEFKKYEIGVMVAECFYKGGLM